MRPFTAGIALWAALSATAADAADVTPCLTRPEAIGLFSAALPDMLDSIGVQCTVSLPESATLRNGRAALVAKYRPAADAAWPQAMNAVNKLGGKELAGVDPTLVKSMAGPMIAAAVAQGIKPADCPSIDRAVTLLSPLPAESVAELIVLSSDVGMKNRKDAPFTICKPEPVAGAAAR